MRRGYNTDVILRLRLHQHYPHAQVDLQAPSLSFCHHSDEHFCPRAHISGCDSMNNALSETARQTAVSCQNLPLSSFINRTAFSVPFDRLFFCKSSLIFKDISNSVYFCLCTKSTFHLHQKKKKTQKRTVTCINIVTEICVQCIVDWNTMIFKKTRTTKTSKLSMRAHSKDVL